MFSLPGFGFVNSFALRTLCCSQRVLRWKMGWGKSLFKVPLDSNHDMFIDTYYFCYNIVRVLRPLNRFQRLELMYLKSLRYTTFCRSKHYSEL